MLLNTGTKPLDWATSLSQKIPNIDVRIWPDIKDKDDINCALIWDPKNDIFHDLNNLEVISVIKH